jgi:hypothetical protein
MVGQFFDVPLEGDDVDHFVRELARARIESEGSQEWGYTARVGAENAHAARARMQRLADDLGLSLQAGAATPSPSSPERVFKAMNDYIGGANAEILADQARRSRQN